MLEAFDADLKANPNMQVQMASELQYYEEQAGQTANTLTGLALFVGVIMGIGAVFGAMNTMYALVAARTREIGTLRALGFSRISILTSFMIESAFLALIGGLLGCLLALPINTLSGATGGANFSQVAFDFRVSPLWLGIAVAAAPHGPRRRVPAGLPGRAHADHERAARRVGPLQCCGATVPRCYRPRCCGAAWCGH